IREILLDLKSLKQEIEFERKLKSAPATARAPQQPGDAANEETTPGSARAGVLTLAVKYHKRGIALVLATLIVAIAAITYWTRTGKPIDSVAILPFVNANADPNTEYLSDGIPESIINSLSQLPRIKVMSRNSVFRFKGREVDAQEVG